MRPIYRAICLPQLFFFCNTTVLAFFLLIKITLRAERIRASFNKSWCSETFSKVNHFPVNPSLGWGLTPLLSNYRHKVQLTKLRALPLLSKDLAPKNRILYYNSVLIHLSHRTSYSRIRLAFHRYWQVIPSFCYMKELILTIAHQ